MVNHSMVNLVGKYGPHHGQSMVKTVNHATMVNVSPRLCFCREQIGAKFSYIKDDISSTKYKMGSVSHPQKAN